MSKHISLPRSRMWRTRAATALAAAGALVMSGGLVMLAAPAATATQGDPEHKVWVCHATTSDSNPYVAIHVDVASTKYEGHLMHRNSPNKFWKSAGTWNGVSHQVGSAQEPNKGDYIEGLDFVGNANWADGALCNALTQGEDEPVVPQVEVVDNCGTQNDSYTVTNAVVDDGDVVQFTYVATPIAGGVRLTFTAGKGFYINEKDATFDVLWPNDEPCPLPPCPGNEETYRAGASILVDQTPGCYEPKSDARLTCIGGRETRSWTEFRPWVWNEQEDEWQLGTVQIKDDTGWVFDRELTTDESDRLECTTDQPSPKVTPLSDQRMTCAGGVEQRSGSQTTNYVWNAETKKYDAVVGPEIWGAWTFVRSLDDAEYQRLQCQPGQPSPEVKPLSGEQKTCENGVEQRSGTQTTTYVWNASTRGYDAVVGAEVWGDWTFVRELNSAELEDLQCVLGTESSAPKPDKTPKPHKTRTPTVLGTQAVAPTAVDAGLASLPGDSGSSTTSLLAQLMVAGGLLLLLAGGWLGLGRREDGAHQA